MASLIEQQQAAFENAVRKAIQSGKTAQEANAIAKQWAEATNFGTDVRVNYSMLPMKHRSDVPESGIAENIGSIVAKNDPTHTTRIWSGQEPNIGLATLSKSQLDDYHTARGQGFDHDKAARIANRVKGGKKYRHPLGRAVDVDVLDIAGNRISDRDITDQHAFDFVQMYGGNVGRGGKGYMLPGRNHYDTAELRSGMGRYWGDIDESFLREMEQAELLRSYGYLEDSRLPIPTGRGVPRPQRKIPTPKPRPSGLLGVSPH